VSIAAAEGNAVHLDVDFMVSPSILNPRRFTLTLEEGMCIELERRDGSEEDVTISLEELYESSGLLRLELPEGVQLESVEDSADHVPDA
jgi:hypothetical protein